MSFEINTDNLLNIIDFQPSLGRLEKNFVNHECFSSIFGSSSGQMEEFYYLASLELDVAMWFLLVIEI